MRMPKRWIAVTVLWLGVVGCDPSPVRTMPPITLHDAIDIVNDNTVLIEGCLKATGSARGHVVDAQGKRQQFDLHTSVQVLSPRYMYATFKSGLGAEEMLLGSNQQKFWMYIKRDGDTYRSGTYASLQEGKSTSLSLRPDLLIEAMGFYALPNTTVGTGGPLHRVADNHQQLFFLAYTDEGQGIIQKEYWLDRQSPRLIRKIIFRDAMGRVVMQSDLDDYRSVGDSALVLPHLVRIDWPQDGGLLELDIRKWNSMPGRGPDHAAFVAPHDRDQTYPRMIDLDTGLSIR